MKGIYTLKKRARRLGLAPGPIVFFSFPSRLQYCRLLFDLSPELPKLWIVRSGGKMYQLLDSNSIKHVFVRRSYDFGERVFGNVYYLTSYPRYI